MTEKKIDTFLFQGLKELESDFPKDDFLFFIDRFETLIEIDGCKIEKDLLLDFQHKIKKDSELLLACFKALLCFHQLLREIVFSESNKMKHGNDLHLERSKWIVFSDVLLVLIHYFVLKTDYPDLKKEKLLSYFTNCIEESLFLEIDDRRDLGQKRFVNDRIRSFILNFDKTYA